MRLRTTTGPWSALMSDARRIRTTVFVDEQGIAPDMEWDEFDETSIHAVSYCLDSNSAQTSDADVDIAIGTGRLIPPESIRSDGHCPAKIGRMAVLKDYRRYGVGDDILQALLAIASANGYTSVELSAQAYVAQFYARHGFVAQGDEYLEVGIAHLKMSKKLS